MRLLATTVIGVLGIMPESVGLAVFSKYLALQGPGSESSLRSLGEEAVEESRRQRL